MAVGRNPVPYVDHLIWRFGTRCVTQRSGTAGMFRRSGLFSIFVYT